MTNLLLNQALGYHRDGFNIIPIEAAATGSPHTGKAPARKENGERISFRQWTRKPQTEEDVKSLISQASDAGNLAILLGACAGGFVYSVDIDNPKAFAVKCGLPAVNNFEELSVTIAEAKLLPNTWVQTSGRGGAYFLRSDQPVKTSTHDWGEIRGTGSYQVVPASTHWTGKKYEWLQQTDQPATLNELPFADLEFHEVTEGWNREMPRLAQSIWRGHIRPGEKYATRSHLDAAFILSLIRAGFREHDIRNLLRTSRHESHYKAMLAGQIKGRSASDAEQWLRWQIQKAGLKENSPAWNQAQRIAGKALSWAMSKIWSGATGLTDRAVFVAHATAMQKCGKPDYHLSRRDISEIAQVSQRTAILSTKRLIVAGLLKIKQSAEGTCAHKYTITMPADVLQAETQNTNASALQLHFCGVFERTGGGLGKATQDVYLTLTKESLTQAQIAQRTGRAKSTVCDAIKTLKEHDLVTSSQEGRGAIFTANIKPDWTSIGKKLGTHNISHLRHMQHLREREQHRKAMELGKLMKQQKQSFASITPPQPPHSGGVANERTNLIQKSLDSRGLVNLRC